MDATQSARRWRETWMRAWPAKDVEAISSLYGAGAVFRSHPFRDPHVGGAGAAEYARWAFADEQAPADVWFAEPVVAGDRVMCEWWAVVRYEGEDVTLAGVAVLRFDAEGRVATQRDYWAQEAGRREPPADWAA